MKNPKNTKHLKIAEQIIIIILFAVLIPMAISGFIINNINQQSVRAQLCNTAMIIANAVSDSVDVFNNSILYELQQISMTINYLDSSNAKITYLKKIQSSTKLYKDIKLVNTESECQKLKKNSLTNNEAIFYEKLNNGKYIVAVFDIQKLKSNLFTSIGADKRQIYLLSHDKKLITAYNFDKNVYPKALKQLPTNLETDKATIYGKKKNQPFVYLKKNEPDILIIVNTPKEITQTYIEYSRSKIIWSMLIAAFTVLFIIGLYLSYLYINIRQLFKAIIAISKGNYKRRIRLLTHIFTPYEIIFLAHEFNRMANQIHKSYHKLQKNNKELKDLNEFRSNMIDTVSHEFRTPLTSIQGYTSRLLRQDIQIDDNTKQKSLKVIKRQAERLKRLVEDLLVIPDIEGANLNVAMQEVNVYDIVEDAIILVKNNTGKTIVNNVDENTPLIYADKDRFEQVIINIVENAVKYADEESEIVIEACEFEEDKIKITVKNHCNIIPKDKLKTLFDKFTRLDDTTTRTTRGTGLGLFIVKGLVEAMEGHIHLHSGMDWGFSVQIFMKKVIDE
ncbi:MAG: HAMP domain-containing histidine kinase [Candidatus Gastranaerophilales bacterium]|nr:HAMP domain-containing histidine kinase [Candidatus Gastranaerophilales bacterium]